jgi:hypothetical protein
MKKSAEQFNSLWQQIGLLQTVTAGVRESIEKKK